MHIAESEYGFARYSTIVEQETELRLLVAESVRGIAEDALGMMGFRLTVKGCTDRSL